MDLQSVVKLEIAREFVIFTIKTQYCMQDSYFVS